LPASAGFFVFKWKIPLKWNFSIGADFTPKKDPFFEGAEKPA